MEPRTDPTDPTISVAVRASAGTGKTMLLARRYLRLIAIGARPRNILALTFTRKAAGEIRERVLKLAENELSADRRELLLAHYEDIAISTIDSFCQGLLREFPLEVQIDPSFEMLDESVVRRLLEEATQAATRDAVRRAAPIADWLGERSLARALFDLLFRRQLLEEPLEAFARKIDRGRAVEAGLRDASRQALALLGGRAGWNGLRALGTAKDAAFELDHADITDFLEERLLVYPAYRRLLRLFLTQENTPRVRGFAYRKDLFDARAWEPYKARICNLAPSFAELRLRIGRALNHALVVDLLQCYNDAKRRFASAKLRAGGLDFDDVLDRAEQMLRGMPEFALTRYRLESRFHHVLVDEFQDTSHPQWSLIRSLIEPWSHGLGLVDEMTTPTILIVGDSKQSIYGFRNADVGIFRRAAREIRELLPRTAGRDAPALNKSYRAPPRLLAFVNDVFDGVEKADPSHDFAFAYDAEDRFPVELAEGDGGEISVCVAGSRADCAQAIAGEVCRRIDKGELRPQEIAILFRTRTGYRDYEEALRRAGVPVYVYRGLGFFDRPEVLDLRALVEFLAEPGSDIAAARLLRSRFARISDPGLRRIAAECRGHFAGFLRGEDEISLDEDDAFALRCLRSSLPRWVAATDRLPPATLVESIIEETRYRAELEELQSREDLKKLLGMFRRAQNRGYLTMARLSARIEEESGIEEAGAVLESVDAVNMMTIHAAKGLEFRAVFLVNMSQQPRADALAPRIYRPGAAGDPIVDLTDSCKDLVSEAVRNRSGEDEKRLLYVAMTRAKEVLCLAAVAKAGAGIPRQGLFRLLPESLKVAMELALSTPGGDRVTWRSETGKGEHTLQVIALPSTAPQLGSRPVSAAVTADLEPLSSEAESRAATDASGELFERATGGRLREVAEVGRVVHRLLELQVPLGDGLVERAAALVHRDIAAHEVPKIAQRAARLYERIAGRSDVRDLLASGENFREVPFCLREGDGTLVRGVIDCIVRRPDGAIVIDYKTGRPKPADESQMEIYRRALRSLLGPGFEIKSRIVYAGAADTEDPSASDRR